MKVNPRGTTAVVPVADEPVAGDAPLSPEGRDQLQKFVDQIHTAVNAQIAALKAKDQPVPPALEEKKHAADELLAAARVGRSMSASEVATQLNALLWELNPAQLTELRDGLETRAKDFGALAKLQHRLIPGLPATLGAVVNLLTDVAKVPTSVHEVDRMLDDVAASEVAHPELSDRLAAQRTLLESMRVRLEKGEAIVGPMSLPTTQAGARTAVVKVTEQLGDVQAQLAALLGGNEPSALTGEAKAKFEKLSAEATRIGEELNTLEAYSMQLDGYIEPTALDRTGVLAGVSIGPDVALMRCIPGLSVPVFGSVGAGLHLFEKDQATGQRKLDWYAAANLHVPFGGAGYALSPSSKGFSGMWNPPLGTQMGISLATHPFHGRKLDVFIPGVFRAEATATGALALTLFAPTVPGIRVGVTVLVRNPVLANVTGPILFVLDKGAEVARKGAELGRQAAKRLVAAVFEAQPPASGLGMSLP